MNNKIYEFNDIPLIIKEEDIYEDNSYTILVGNNGVGKSRLLSALSRSLIETTHYELSSSFRKALEYLVYLDDPKIIAVSTSPFDAFRLPRRGADKKEFSTSNYRYVGMRSNGLYSSGSISLISSASHGLLDKMLHNKGFDRLTQVFQVLGFEPHLEFIFKPLFTYDHIESTDSADPFKDISVLKIEKTLGVRLDSKLYNIAKDLDAQALDEIFSAINCFLSIFPKHSYLRLSAGTLGNFEHTWEYRFNNTLTNDETLLKATQTLLQYDFIRLMDLKLSKPSNPDMSLRMASSGEQCMLVIMLGIAGHISDYSKIFIDEPEISLHPAWQEKFMSLLIEVFSSYKGCNFFIATHSPQIVSKLQINNCYITSLSKKQIFNASDFRERSADFQLAEIFDAPGVMNEYLIRKAFGLMAKIKAAKEMSTEDYGVLETLSKFSEKLDTQDPLLELIKTVKEMCNYYAAN